MAQAMGLPGPKASPRPWKELMRRSNGLAAAAVALLGPIAACGWAQSWHLVDRDGQWVEASASRTPGKVSVLDDPGVPGTGETELIASMRLSLPSKRGGTRQASRSRTLRRQATRWSSGSSCSCPASVSAPISRRSDWPQPEPTSRHAPLGQSMLQVGDGPSAYLTASIAGQHMYVAEFTEASPIDLGDGFPRLRVSVRLGQTDRGEDGSRLARLESEPAIRAGMPCLLVTSRTVNLGPTASLYCWWGWLPGASSVTPLGEHEWRGQYSDVGGTGGVYLPPLGRGQPGIGWIAPGVFGESRFRTMLLYTDPQTIETAGGGLVILQFALIAATSTQEVESVARQLRTADVWQ